MPDPNETHPEDTFSFVDKRRTLDPVEENYGTDSAVDESTTTQATVPDEFEPPSAQTSIYDIAAYCTGLLITEGFQRMGLIADPNTGKAVMDLPSARVAIDCVSALVQVLDEPTSTLPDPVRREMKRTLNDLRLNYIDRVRE